MNKVALTPLPGFDPEEVRGDVSIWRNVDFSLVEGIIYVEWESNGDGQDTLIFSRLHPDPSLGVWKAEILVIKGEVISN